jgi:membrane protease YdiL (CAAX protease family)
VDYRQQQRVFIVLLVLCVATTIIFALRGTDLPAQRIGRTWFLAPAGVIVAALLVGLNYSKHRSEVSGQRTRSTSDASVARAAIVALVVYVVGSAFASNVGGDIVAFVVGSAAGAITLRLSRRR